MISKNISLFVVLIVCMFAVSAQDCYFDTYNEGCQRLETSINSFSVNVNSQDVGKITYEIYNVNNPSNKLYFEKQNININQLMPFLEPGVYAVNVKVYDKAGNYDEESKEYIFDNLQPSPPIVPINLRTTTNQITVEGEAKPNQNVWVDVNLRQFSARADSEGYFSIIMTLNSGINYAKFYVQNENGLKSADVERVILSGEIEENEDLYVGEITFDNLVQLNERTINGFTTKRNFYVQGTAEGAQAGAVVYVNGVKALVDSNSKFGTFVLLNQGDNEIVAQGGNQVSEVYDMTYESLKFKILEADYDKIVTTSAVNIVGEVNFDYPVLVFLNGRFVEEYVPNNEEFDIQLNNLKPGKNFIEIRGINNQRVTDVIYYDVRNPTAVLVGSDDFTGKAKVVFKISDDIGINVRTVSLRIDGNEVDAASLEVKGDYYIFDLLDFSEGDVSYVLTGEDLSGKLFDLSGMFSFDSQNTLINEIILDGSVIGDQLYVRNGDVELVLVPSRNIAFKSIFLDNVEQIDYEILSNNNVRIRLDFKKASGNLRLTFINNEYDEFVQEFKYFTDISKPEVKLDYVVSPYTTQKAKITGEIVGSNFDWDTLMFNSQKSFTKYGNYFEAIIDVDEGAKNLRITGSDYCLNSFSEDYGYLLYGDSAVTRVYLAQDSDKFELAVEGSMPDSDEHKEHYSVLNYVDSYDGFETGKVYIASDGFKLPVQDRPGYRSLNLKGYESSGLGIVANNHFRILPQGNMLSQKEGTLEVFFAGNDMRTVNSNTFVQGHIITSSAVTRVTSNLGTDCDFDDSSFVCDIQLRDGENEIEVSVFNEEGLMQAKTITGFLVENDLDVRIDEILGDKLYSGNGMNYLYGDEFVIDGYVNEYALIRTLINGEDMLNNMYNGSFSFDVSLGNLINGADKTELSVQLKAEDEYGNEVYSNVVKVLYQRVFETFAKVIVR